MCSVEKSVKHSSHFLSQANKLFLIVCQEKKIKCYHYSMACQEVLFWDCTQSRKQAEGRQSTAAKDKNQAPALYTILIYTAYALPQRCACDTHRIRGYL